MKEREYCERIGKYKNLKKTFYVTTMTMMMMTMMYIINNISMFFHIGFVIIQEFLDCIYFISKVLESFPWPYYVVF